MWSWSGTQVHGRGIMRLNGGERGVDNRSYRTIHQVCMAVVLWTVAGAAQWIEYPTRGIPRTADGKPNLAALVPKAADGKPDLSGLWLRASSSNERVTNFGDGPQPG